MLDVDMIDDETMNSLLSRLGVDWDRDEDKAEQDEIRARSKIAHMNAHRAFREFCEWHGLVGWSGKLVKVWENLKAAEQEKTNATN